MLNQLRRGAGSFIAKIFIGLLIASFAVWGIADQVTGVSDDTVVEVGNQQVSAADYQREFSLQVRELSQRQGRPVSAEEARQFGLDRTVLARLVGIAVLDNEAEQMGLAASDEAVARHIQSDSAFQDAFGKFSRSVFDRRMADNQLTEEVYIRDQRASIARYQLLEAVESGVALPDSIAQQVFFYQTEERVAEYFRIDISSIGDAGEPDETTVAQIYENAASRFTTPETRDVTLVSMPVSALAESLEIPDDQLAALYEERRDRYDIPERRAVDQITFPSMDEAKAAYQRLQGGESFVELAQDLGLGLKDTDLGTIRKSEMLSPEVAEATFALPQGGVSEPVEGPLGPVIVRVREIFVEVPSRYEDVKEELRTEIAQERAHDELFDIYDAIEDARAGGATLEEISERYDLPLASYSGVNADGTSGGEDGPELPAYERLIPTIFGYEVGEEIPPGDTEDGGFYWVRVDGITPSSQKPLDEVRDEIVEVWQVQERGRMLVEKAEALAERGDQGTPIETLASEVGGTVATSRPLARQFRDEVFSRQAVANLFAAPEGDFAYGPVGYGDGMVVMKVAEIRSVDPKDRPAAFSGLKDRLDEALTADVIATYINGLEEQAPVRTNEELLLQLRGTQGGV